MGVTLFSDGSNYPLGLVGHLCSPAQLSRDDLEELKRLRGEVAELRMERDVLKRSVVLPVLEATK